jgi:hypothetical protein
MRSIGANVGIAGPIRRQVTRWSCDFTAQLRDRAERVRLDSKQQVTVRSSADDPWREAELEAQTLAQSWFPSPNEGRFFPNAQESTLGAVEFLADLMRRAGLVRVLITDPFFDRIGVESLLTRLGDVKEVRVVASHVTDGSSTLAEKIRDLAAACDLVLDVLPRNLEVLNLENPGESTQQFHDRYILIEFGNGQQILKREVWMLSNSLSSLAENLFCFGRKRGNTSRRDIGVQILFELVMAAHFVDLPAKRWADFRDVAPGISLNIGDDSPHCRYRSKGGT